MLQMNKKVLFCATVDYHFHAFHLPYFKWFKEKGWEVHVAASGKMDLPYVDKKYDIPFQRSPFKKLNISAYQQLKRLMNENQYEILHCHTPMGGVLARLAAKSSRKNGTKVIYTAHGFHFCKGAPLVNWLVYFPIEKFLSSYSDTLITINHEDYHLAIKRGFKAKSIKHVHGVGVNTDNFKPISEKKKLGLRDQYGYRPDDFLMFYAAEFNKNKNQKLLIEVVAQLKNDLPHAKLLLAGEGPLLEPCRELAVKLGVIDMIDFLGFRKDIVELLNMSDIAVASSLREGLPVNIMEAMASGLPVVASANRGHKELIANGENGWYIDNRNLHNFVIAIKKLAINKELTNELGTNAREKMMVLYSSKKILEEITVIYKIHMKETEDKKWAVQ